MEFQRAVLYRPDLFDNLISTIDARLVNRYSAAQDDPQDAIVLRRSLGILDAVIKEFASMKMLNGMKVMANVGCSVTCVFLAYQIR